MAKLVMLFSFFLPFLLLVVEKTTGLTLKLIHLDSPESPFYNINATYMQRIQRLLLQSKAREHYLSRNMQEEGAFPQTVRPTVSVQPNSAFMAQAFVGTFPHRNPHYIPYFLLFDTGSDLVWIQCEDCQAAGNHCFRQVQPIFPNSRSKSYRPIPCHDHQHCHAPSCKGKFCTYYVEYLDESSSTGILAREAFTFDSSTGGQETLDLVFGCGYDQKYFSRAENNKVAGILGLGISQPYPSFADQLRPQSNGRFSYCVPPSDEDGHVPHSFLRFGRDIPHRTNLNSIGISTYPNEHGYFLNLRGLSLAGRRLSIPENNFTRGRNSRGCIIDSGSSLSHLSEYPFNQLVSAIIDHFPSDSGFFYVGELFGFNLCFRRPDSSGFEQLPRITFHFDEADLEVMPKNLYVLGDAGFYRFFCLGILRARHGLNVIGAMQQTNQRIIFDIENMRLHFGPSDCARNS